MKNRKPSFRYSIVRIRRPRKSALIRNIMVSSIAVLILIMSVAIAYWMDKPKSIAVQSSQSTRHFTTAATYLTEEETTVTQAPTENSTTALTEIATVAVGDEYFADACFIGDSRTQGLMMYSAPESATFLALKGMTVESFFKDKAFEKKTKTAEQMLKKHKFGKIYIMLGLNELGWSYSNLFIKRYGELIDSIKESQPKAKIFVQSILPVSADKSSSHKSFNNPRIMEYNRMVFNMCVEKQVIYLNVRESVEDKKGNLPKEATTDGIHMNKAYCDKWMQYLRTHTDASVAQKQEVASTSTDTTNAASTAPTVATDSTEKTK